jgi:hypothetical protein
MAPMVIDEEVAEAHGSEHLPMDEGLCGEAQSQHRSHEPKESCPSSDPLPCAISTFA